MKNKSFKNKMATLLKRIGTLRTNTSTSLVIHHLKRISPYRKLRLSECSSYSTESAASKMEEFSLRYLEGKHEGFYVCISLLIFAQIPGYKCNISRQRGGKSIAFSVVIMVQLILTQDMVERELTTKLKVGVEGGGTWGWGGAGCPWRVCRVGLFRLVDLLLPIYKLYLTSAGRNKLMIHCERDDDKFFKLKTDLRFPLCAKFIC